MRCVTTVLKYSVSLRYSHTALKVQRRNLRMQNVHTLYCVILIYCLRRLRNAMCWIQKVQATCAASEMDCNITEPANRQIWRVFYLCGLSYAVTKYCNYKKAPKHGRFLVNLSSVLSISLHPDKPPLWTVHCT